MASLIFVLMLAPIWIDPHTVRDLTGPLAPAPEQTSAPPRPTAAALPSTGPGTTQGPLREVARDAFDRTVTDGWGSAEVGGTYSILGPIADYDVHGKFGTVLLPEPGRHRAAILPAARGGELDLTFAVSFDSAPAGGSLYVYGVLRHTSTGAAYRPKVFITPDGSLYAHVGLQRRGGESSLGRPAFVASLTDSAGAVIRVRMVATGSDPTTIRVRAWLDGEAEPDYWHFGAIDWTGSLQGEGGVGIAAYLGSRVTSGPLTLTVSDLLATTTDPIP